MSNIEPKIEIIWHGPYSWPKYEDKNNLKSIPKKPGVYLQAVEYLDGYLIYAAGLTRRVIPIRLREHTYKYMNGDYNVLDIDAMQQGVRNEVWHGWGWNPDKRVEFKKRKKEIIKAVQKQLTGFRIFIADIGTKPRILERLEASIMNNLYEQPAPICDIPDKGMMLMPRWDSETPIVVKNICDYKIFGLPTNLKI
jgi:hypothetical protein